jgi:hypothetical protein
VSDAAITHQSRIPPGDNGVCRYQSILSAAFAGIRCLAGLHLSSSGKALKDKASATASNHLLAWLSP